MATRKKKVEETSTKKPAVITAAPKKKTTKKSTGTWPKITKGSHLTVITHEDGKTELEWDDDALARDVREAIASAEMANLKPAVKAKVATRKKKVAS
jgi:hypothetical protein